MWRWLRGQLAWLLSKLFPSRTADREERRGSLSRRDLLRGRLGALFQSQRDFAPLVMRYPKSREDIDPQPAPDAETTAPRAVKGINIQPVKPTEFSSKDEPPAEERLPVFRPPGAIEESRFLAGCTSCGDCVTACPHDAIRPAPDRWGAIASTPIIEADVQPCLMCEDFPCITSCGERVLVDSIPKLMGTARITPHLCIAHHGTTCTVCSERCPVEGAIVVSDGKPHVTDACTGCGVCRYVCPAPENAVLLMPTFQRPLA